MALVHDLSSRVDEHHVWNATNAILLTAVRSGPMVVSNSFPSFSFNMIDDCIGCVINTDADDLDLVTSQLLSS